MNRTQEWRPGAASGSKPSTNGSSRTADDPRVLRVLREFWTAVEAGLNPDRREFLARHPDIAEELAQCLDGLDLVRGAAPHLKPSASLGLSCPGIPSAELQPLTPLGDFQILREIGCGGMGIVYEAVQLSLGRRVALKVLPFAAAVDARQLQRFKNEAQAAAHLHHTNIVPVFGVGCERGVHYYAMQFIEGRTLAALIEEFRELAGIRPASSDGSEASRPCRRPATAVARLSGVVPSATRTPATSRPPTCTGRGEPAPAGEPMSGIACTLLSGQLAAPPRSVNQAGNAPSSERSGSGTASACVTTGPGDRLFRGISYFRMVAQLGAQAAEALEHAHALGVVHRDIKPANLLVDVRGNLWITDFGLAHVRSNATLTITGDVVGTLRYMSPEQALAKRALLDHRTDIYSLGVTLYELCSLEPAFSGSDRQELLRQIAFEEPRAPRRLNKTIPRELETIIAKAMEKNPAERYATAQEFADDLRRFLEDKPILAKRPSPSDYVVKWARRHKAILTAVACLLVLAALGSVASTFLIWQEQVRTRDALAVANHQQVLAGRSMAEARRERERSRLNFLRLRVAVIQLFRNLEDKRWSHVPQINDVRKSMAEELLQFFQGFLNEGTEEPAARLEAGWAYMLMGNVYRVQGDCQESQKHFRKAIELFEGLVAEAPEEPIYQQELGLAYCTLGSQLDCKGKTVEAVDLFRKALTHYEQASLAKLNCRGLNNYAWFLVTCTQPAFRDPQKALRLAQQGLALEPECGETWNTLGVAHYRAGNWQAAITALHESMARRSGGDGWDWIFLAMAYWQMGDQQQARHYFQKAIAGMDKTNTFMEPITPFRQEAAALLGISDRLTPKDETGCRE